MKILTEELILDSLQSYLSRSLQTGSLTLDNSQADGSLNSQTNERQISDALRLYSLANDQFQKSGFRSLKRFPEQTQNGNNPPFQCNWSRNRIHAQRSLKEAQTYILETLRQTFVLRAKALESFDQYIHLKAP